MKTSLPRTKSLVVLMAVLGLLASVMGEQGTEAMAQVSEQDSRVHPDLFEEVTELDDDGEIEALVVLDETADLSERAQEPRSVAAELRTVAGESQAQLAAQLEFQAPDTVRILNDFWLLNALLVEVPATTAALESLASLPGVDRLIPNFEVTEGAQPSGSGSSASAPPVASSEIIDDRTYGIDRIEAHRAWRELDVTGAGVRVATLDSGVDITHPDLAGKMVTDDPGDPSYPGGWMEFGGPGDLIESTPYATSDHGTHVAGTIHGGATAGVAIGVAPEAQMMHGLIIPGGSGGFTQVIAGMQWALDPTDADGTPAGSPPEVINMSLGVGGYHEEFIEPAQAIVAAGIFPAFSIGNPDPLFGHCTPGRVIGSGSPGNVYEAVGVGATDVNDDVADFSCGEEIDTAEYWEGAAPPEWPDRYVKPDLTAPGEDVYSAVPGGTYEALSGTSMAAPHVAGTAALVLEAAPHLDPDHLQQTLSETAHFDDRHGSDRPNQDYGQGRVNAFWAAFNELIDSGIEGYVVDDSGEVVPDAIVTIEQTGREINVDGAGEFRYRLESGSYDLTAEAFGYEPMSLSEVVVEDGFASVELSLDPSPTGQVAGSVEVTGSGTPVPGAEITVDQTPLTTTTDEDGDFILEGVPAGTQYLELHAPGFYTPEPLEITVEAGTTTEVEYVLDPVRDDIALVTTMPEPFVDYFGLIGVVPEVYGYDELAEAGAASHDVYIVGYHHAQAEPDPDEFNAFIDTTDANASGVLFLDHAFGEWNGVRALSEITGTPAETGEETSDGAPAYYEVTAEHPVVEDYEVGDQILHEPDTSDGWIGWFSGYEGEGIQIIADMGRNDETGIYGHGIAVDDRSTNRHVLLSSHAPTGTRAPEDWSAGSTDIFENALHWVMPDPPADRPRFVVWDLQAPDDVKMGEPGPVSVQVANVGTAGGEHSVELLVDEEPEGAASVELEPGESETVSWDVVRNEPDTFRVEVDHLIDEFRVRGPEVTVDVMTLEGGSGGPESMEAARVSILSGGSVRPVGVTGEDGSVVVESPVTDEDVVVVVQRGGSSEQQPGYLLQRPVLVDGDQSVEFRPDLDGEGWDESAVVDLALEPVADDHQGWTYLAGELTAPLGFAVEPGETVVPAGEYEARHMHVIPGTVRDWWFAGDEVAVDAVGGQQSEHEFGGEAAVELEVAAGDGAQFTADWVATDEYGIGFTAASSTDLPRRLNVPGLLSLEDAPSWVVGAAPREAELTMSVDDPSGALVHAGVLSWDERSVTRDLVELTGDDDPIGYRLHLQAEIGAWGADVDTDALIPYQPWRRLPSSSP